MDLPTVVKLLNHSGILAAARLVRGRFSVWLGDAHQGVAERADFERAEDAARWLSAAGIRHYPDSAFAIALILVSALTRQPSSPRT